MARESIEQALLNSNLNLYPVQIGAGYRATRSANPLVFCDSPMESAISKTRTPLGLAPATPSSKDVRRSNRQPPLVSLAGSAEPSGVPHRALAISAFGMVVASCSHCSPRRTPFCFCMELRSQAGSLCGLLFCSHTSASANLSLQ
jgi:hypothetical protein